MFEIDRSSLNYYVRNGFIKAVADDNKYYEAYYLALKYIDTKMRNKKEVVVTCLGNGERENWYLYRNNIPEQMKKYLISCCLLTKLIHLSKTAKITNMNRLMILKIYKASE